MLNARYARSRILVGLVVLIGLLVIRQALAQDGGDPGGGKNGAAKDGNPETLFELILAGGVVMIPLGMCSVAAVALAIERAMNLRRRNVIPGDFLVGLKETLQKTSCDADVGVAYCEKRPCAISNIFKAGLARMHDGEALMEKAIEDAGAHEVHKLKRSLRPLSVIVTVSPLLGLLGTVYGLISAFQSTTAMGVGKSVALAVGIYQALVTTAAGLTIAIPALVVVQLLSSRIDFLVDDIDHNAIQLLEYTVRSKGHPVASKT